MNSNDGGTYGYLSLDESQLDLYRFVVDFGVKNVIRPDLFHCTTIYDPVNSIREARKLYLKYHLETVYICRSQLYWKIFDSNGLQVLALGIKTEEESPLMKVFGHRTRNGMKYSYQEYVPHITISYDYGSHIPPDVLPYFDLTLVSETINKLNPALTAADF